MKKISGKYEKNLPDLDKRHQKRYMNLVESHLKPNQRLATASQAKMGTSSSWAATQSAWRFYANKKTSLSKLSSPLIKASCEGIFEHCQKYALVVHDWSGLNYTHHESKKDKKVLHNRYEQGYELPSSIVLSDRNGIPLGVLAQNLTTGNGVWSSYQGDNLQPEREHLQELSTRVKWLEQQLMAKRQVPIVDREGDAMEWLRANRESYWLFRCRQNSTVSYGGTRYQVRQLAQQLTYSPVRCEIKYKGKVAYQTTAYIAVDLVRAAKPKRKQKDKDQLIKGDALSAQLIVSRVEDRHGKCLSQWYWLSNVFTVSPETLATWYYWRWQVESFFKLLKQQG